ncbi:hypothetical protein PRNP1_012915 [Phytophthora ramorum]
MDGDTPADFLQDLDLWLLQGGAQSPTLHNHSLHPSSLNADIPSLEAALLTPPARVSGAAKSGSTESFAASLTDDSLPWAALQTVSPVDSASVSLPSPTPRPPTPQGAANATETQTTRARKGRPPSTTEPSKKKGKTNKSTSQRQKEELAYLREKAEELEADLTTLKQRNREELERQQREQEQKEFAGGDVSTAMVTRDLNEMIQPPQQEVSLWERIAKRQREEKGNAEVENVKLREMVQSQMRLVKSFERLLRKRRIWDQLQESSNQDEGDSRNADEVLEDMLRDVDSRYPLVDMVLNEHGLGESDPEVDISGDANMKYSPTDGMYLEHKEKKFMPFDYKFLNEVVWRSSGEGKLKLEDSQVTVLKNTDELLYTRTNLPLPRKGSSLNESKDMGSTVILTVLKRFVERNRMVYVWLSTTRVDNSGDNGTSPVLVVQKGYGVMGTATLPDGSPGCAIRTYTTSMPTLSNVPSELGAKQQQAKHREVGLLTEMVFAAYQQGRQSINQTIENLILDEMIAKNASTPAASTADTDVSST